jgi:hypothetical protein
MADTNREADLARAAEELHGATSELREILGFLPYNVVPSFSGGRSPGFGDKQPEPSEPFLRGSGDPNLAERFEDELNGAA